MMRDVTSQPQLTNWGGNIAFTAQRFHRPTSVEELQRIVAGSERVRALGTGHSFNAIADTSGDLVSVADLPHTVELDAERRTVTVAAGVSYGELAASIHAQGYALHNLGSLPHISVGGACSTGTHGSGDTNGNLATAVAALEIVTADGALVTASRAADGEAFAGMVLALGALGIVTRLTLDVQPAYDVRQYVYEKLPHDQIEEHFAEIFARAYSVSVFTNWRDGRHQQAWLKQRVTGSAPPPLHWMGGVLAHSPRNPVPDMPPANSTPQMGAPGPWHERLPHFRADFTPSSGDEIQSEYLLPREGARDALQAIRRVHHLIAPVLQISEIRTVAADGLWLSPSYGRDSVALHFTFVQDTAAVLPVLATIEEQLAPFAARPHWAKLFGTDPLVLRGFYERFADFQQLVRTWDPGGKFRNEFLDRYLLMGR
jgi:alditol oxidase